MAEAQDATKEASNEIKAIQEQQASEANEATSERRKKILEQASKKDVAIAKEALERLQGMDNWQPLLEKAINNANSFLVTHKLVDEIIESENAAQKAKQVIVVQRTDYKPAAKDVAPQVEIDRDADVTGKSRCTGTVDDFVTYFKDRFHRIGGMIKGRASKHGVTSITSAKNKMEGRPCRIIGMIAEKRTTRNGHIIIDFEDEEDSVPVFIGKDSPLKALADEIILDEVVGVDGAMSKSLFIASDIVWPEMPFRKRKTIEEDISVAMISDLHIGSKLFLQDGFQHFLDFLNGNGTKEEQEIASKIKYITIAGDCVDGIGIYPSQEKQLVVKDVYTQYEIFCEYIKKIPEYIEVIIAPGNHDAVRLAEPQPQLLPEFIKPFEGYKNIHLVGNPGWVDLHGIKTLLYHGGSQYSIIGALPSLRNGFENPEKVAVEMLKRRELNPIYGEEPIAPEGRDYLVVDKLPDIMHFGDVHKNGYTDYRGTLIVNSGCWQDITDYQIKIGHHPSPCQLPIYNLKTTDLRVLNFKQPEAIA